MSHGLRLRTPALAEVINQPGARGKTGIIDGTDIRVRRPLAGRKDQDRFISGRRKQNAFKTMVVTDGDGRVLVCSAAKPGSCADITHARQLTGEHPEKTARLLARPATPVRVSSVELVGQTLAP